MTQQLSPWLETAYGWSYGESGWNPGMDSNIIKFSVLFDRNVDSIVASLPTAENGKVHYNTSDNRLYFVVNTTYFSTPVPKWFTVIVRSTGITWQYNGTTLVQIDNVSGLDARLDAVELVISNLGSAAFEDVEYFATQSELDIVEADAQTYTDNSLSVFAVNRLQTKAAAAASSIAGSAIIEGDTAAGDGAANIVVLDADDATSPNDGVRAIESAGGTLRSVLHMQGAEIPLPAGFGYTPLVKIIKTSKGYAADKDVRSLMPAITGVTYYVDYITGNDANAGTSVAPLKGIKAALAKPDVGRVKVAPAFYPHNYNWASSFPAGVNFAVERWEGVRPGPVINSTADDALTWTVNGTYSNVWQATRSIVAKVRDYSRRAADGRYFEYRSVASLLLCSQTSGTYYYDGSIVYVNTLENVKPHAQIKVFLETAAAYFNTPFAVLIDGIEFHGGREAFYPTNTSAAGGLLIANDCKFMYAQNATVGNGVRLEGIEDSYFQNCEASYNNRDGFNYHVATTVIPKVTEINCRGFYNGQDGAGVNNGSTMHDAGRIVRIGGEFAYSEGPQVVDVGDSKSFNAGVHAYASRLGLDTIANASFYLSGGDMWLLDCDAEYSLYDVVATSGGTVHLCRTPVRSFNVAPSYFVQKTGAVLA